MVTHLEFLVVASGSAVMDAVIVDAAVAVVEDNAMVESNSLNDKQSSP